MQCCLPCCGHAALPDLLRQTMQDASCIDNLINGLLTCEPVQNAGRLSHSEVQEVTNPLLDSAAMITMPCRAIKWNRRLRFPSIR